MPAIFCVQKTATKVKVTEQDLVQSNINGFGDTIGSVTNRATAMFDILALYEEGSKEYEEVLYRIICGQHYQQCAIDKIKGIEFNPMPKEWYDSRVNIIGEEDDEETIAKKEFNMSIVADKKPYFFIYNYPKLKIEYNAHRRSTESRCYMLFREELDELLNKENRTEEEQAFYEDYMKYCPVTETPSTMNKICKTLEDKFKGIKVNVEEKPFDYTIFKTDIEYTKKIFNDLKKVYAEYKEEVNTYRDSSMVNKFTKDEKNKATELFKEEFKQKCLSVCPDREILCEVLLDICYKKEGTKQFVWDLCGDLLIKRLLFKHEDKINYPYEDENGDTIYNGKRFSLGQATVLTNRVEI